MARLYSRHLGSPKYVLTKLSLLKTHRLCEASMRHPPDWSKLGSPFLGTTVTVLSFTREEGPPTVLPLERASPPTKSH